MTYDCNWGETPLYKAHIAKHGEGAPFGNEHGLPFPLGGVMWLMLIAKKWEITTKNAAEVYARIATYHKVVGEPFATSWDGKNKIEHDITPADVAQCIGLRTNAGDSTKTEFVAHMVKLSKRESKQPLLANDVKQMLVEFTNEFNDYAIKAMIAQGGK